MSAVPENILVFSTYADPVGALDWVVGGDTLSTDLPARPLSDGVPDNVTNAPRSDGITWGGALTSAMKTAESLAGTFGKVYQLNSQIEGQNFQRKVTEQQLSISRSQTLGALDIAKAKIDANSQIELARAGRATADALSQVKAGAAGYTKSPFGMSTPVMVIAGMVGAFLIYKGVKK